MDQTFITFITFVLAVELWNRWIRLSCYSNRV